MSDTAGWNRRPPGGGSLWPWVVRDALDAAYPTTAGERRAAGQRILDAAPMPVPDVDGLRAELDQLRGRRG